MAQFTVNGTTLFYEVLGNPECKETVAFFNGVMASTNSWYLLTPIFEKLGFRIVLHDFKGQLKSDKPAGPYTFKEHCDEAKALFDFLGVEKVHLVGTSYGGEISMRFAMEYPEMTKSISVIDSVSELDPICEGLVLGWKIYCDTGDGEAFFHAMAPSIYGPDFIIKNKEMLAARAKAIKHNPNGYLEGQKILYDTFVNEVTMTDRLHEIKCPALIVVGDQDFLKPIKFSQIIADNIANSEFVILPNCGHVSIFEKPNGLQTLLSGFILKNS